MIRSLKRLYHLLEAIVANIWFGFPARSLTIIGVTGTDGKTTTTTLIYHILKEAGFSVSMITSVNAIVGGKKYDTGFHVTTPSAFLVQKYIQQARKNGDTHFVLEVTSHALDQFRVWGIPFAVGVITNVTHEHLDWHGTFENYRRTKISLLKNCTVGVVGADDEELFKNVKKHYKDKTIITFGIHKKADVTPKNQLIQTTLPGEFNIYNCLAALSVSHVVGVPQQKMLRALSRFQGVPGRMEEVYAKSFRIIIDFAHTPNAFDKALQTIRTQTQGRMIHVFGCAADRDRLKRPVMGKLSARYADIIILTEEDYRKESVEKIMDEIAAGIPKSHALYRFPNRQDAITFAISLAKSGDTVVLTGKAHEKSLCRGTVEYPWSEQDAVKIGLKLKK